MQKRKPQPARWTARLRHAAVFARHHVALALMAAAAAALAVSLVKGFDTQARLERDVEEARAALAAHQAALARLEDKLAFMQTDAYIIQQARAQYGLTLPGSVRFVAGGADDAGGLSDVDP